MRDSSGTSVTGETPAGACAKRLTARPAESEQPGAEINSYQTSWTAPLTSHFPNVKNILPLYFTPYVIKNLSNIIQTTSFPLVKKKSKLL